MKRWMQGALLGAGLVFFSTQTDASAMTLHERAEVFTGETIAIPTLFGAIPGVTVEIAMNDRFKQHIIVHIDRALFKSTSHEGLPEEEVALIALVLASTPEHAKVALEFESYIVQNEHIFKTILVVDQTKHISDEERTELARYKRIVNPQFTDIEALESREAILRLARLGIVTGTTSQTFTPNAPITRAQFSAMLRRTIPNTEPFLHSPFTDLETAWTKEDIVTLYSFGIVKGLPVFNPGNSITRSQSAVMIKRYLQALDLDISTIATTSPFIDIKDLALENQEAIGLMYQLGIIKGKSPEHFDPHGKLTRAQMAKILDGILQLSIH